MKPATAAKKLGIFLPAAPPEFQDGLITRTQFLELQSTPPEWLTELRRVGPHPKQVVAQKLGISVSGLTRAGAPTSMSTAEIKELLETKPEWLVVERATQAAVHEENARIKSERRAKGERASGAK
jgi:hypothetical protein